MVIPPPSGAASAVLAEGASNPQKRKADEMSAAPVPEGLAASLAEFGQSHVLEYVEKGLVSAADGTALLDKVATKVFLLSPADVDVTAEQRRRIAEAGFYAYQ